MAADFDPQLVAQIKVGASAFAGGIIYHAMRPAKTWPKLLVGLMSNVLCGVVFTAPVMHYFSIDQSLAGGVGAVLGLFGLAIAGGILKAVEQFNFGALVKGGK